MKRRFLLQVLLVGITSLLMRSPLFAEIFTNLHSFTAISNSGPYTNSDGAHPFAGLILSENVLYGTTGGGGSAGYGTIFGLNNDGTVFTNLHNFTGGIYGFNFVSGLVASNNTLFGTTYHDGAYSHGTVIAVNTDGTGFTNLHAFTGGVTGESDGSYPRGGLILSGNTLYGTSSDSLPSYGTVFELNTDGSGFTNVYRFSGGNDGATPTAGLILSSNMLFGTASHGGGSGVGTVFAVNPDGTGFINLHSFTALSNGSYGTNTDGGYPFAGLIISSNTLYGAANSGGTSGQGTLFSIHTDGTSFTVLHSFDGVSEQGYPSGLVLDGNTLYGTTFGSGANGSWKNGTVFKIKIDGTGFTTLYTFSAIASTGPYTNSDGANPNGLIRSGNTLYGTTQSGGASGNGTVFSLFIQPQLTIIPAGPNVVLSWPTNASGFSLQSTTNLVSPGDWQAVSPDPVSVNGMNIVTNPISATPQFYRLRK